MKHMMNNLQCFLFSMTTFVCFSYTSLVFGQFEERLPLLQLIQEKRQKIFDRVNAEARRDCYDDDIEACAFLESYVELSDYDKAVAINRKACDAGSTAACTLLTKLFTTRDLRLKHMNPIELYTTACSDGFKLGCRALEYLENLGL